MAKKTVFICDGTRDDGKGSNTPCGAVLVNADDGFVLAGTIAKTVINGDTKVLISGDSDTALCRECMAKVLGFPHP